MTFTIILLTLIIASAVICHMLAKKQGAKPVFWGTMGVLFGPFAIIALLFFTKKTTE